MATSKPLKKVEAASAAEVCARFELRDEARPLVTPAATPRGFLETLEARGDYPSALSFLAHALPAREAVWWGCLCVKHAASAPLPSADAEALKAVAEWVLEPTEPRRAAAAERAAEGSPAGTLALAVRWTGGTLAPPDPKIPVVPPGPWLPAKAVAGAVLLASARAEPARIAGAQKTFLQLGIDVAEGRVTWPAVKPKAPRGTWGR